MADTCRTVKVGEKYGRLTVVAVEGITKWGKKTFRCQCECGNETVVIGSSLKSGNTSSCGCLGHEAKKKNTRTHGMSRTRLYHIYMGMKMRCTNPKYENFKHYGGRGITVCEEWKSFEPFYKWAMAAGYSDALSIDRIDVNGNYEPSNCRWATISEQHNNTRANHYVEAFGEKHTIKEWSEIIGIDYGTLRSRFQRGWEAEEALQCGVDYYEVFVKEGDL